MSLQSKYGNNELQFDYTQDLTTAFFEQASQSEPILNSNEMSEEHDLRFQSFQNLFAYDGFDTNLKLNLD
jgi:hypothetical protein